MKRYKVVVWFEARSLSEAAELAADPRRLPPGTRMQVLDIDHRRTVRLAAFLASLIVFWGLVGMVVFQVLR